MKLYTACHLPRDIIAACSLHALGREPRIGVFGWVLSRPGPTGGAQAVRHFVNYSSSVFHTLVCSVYFSLFSTDEYGLSLPNSFFFWKLCQAASSSLLTLERCPGIGGNPHVTVGRAEGETLGVRLDSTPTSFRLACSAANG